jgi:hypothetical protein
MAAMTIAKKCPRDINAAFSRIIQSCKRKALADAALYSYPRGGSTITGPSIRLAESLAQNWGNLDFGIVELDQKDGESSVMSYAWDLETNTRQTKVFQVKHERKAKGQIVKLEDPRDIYELVANLGARRLRACILGVIPGDVVDAAVDECEKTMKAADGNIPLTDRIRQMSAAFLEVGVDGKMLETRMNHKLSATSEAELVGLRKIYRSLKDGMSGISDWFKEVAPRTDLGKDAVGDALKTAAESASPVDDLPPANEKKRGRPKKEAVAEPSTAPAVPPEEKKKEAENAGYEVAENVVLDTVMLVKIKDVVHIKLMTETRDTYFTDDVEVKPRFEELCKAKTKFTVQYKVIDGRAFIQKLKF